MEDKDRFDRLMKLAEFRLRRWDARRAFEWKISLSLWGLFAAAAYYINKPPNMLFVGLVLIFVVVAYSAMWTIPILVRNDEDMDTAFYYSQKAEEVLGIETDVRPKPKQRRGTKDYLRPLLRGKKWDFSSGIWAPAFETVTTATLAFCTFWILWGKPSN